MTTTPHTLSFAEWRESDARELLAPFITVPGGLLPALHALLERYGYIPQPAVAVLADVLNLSRAEVHGVISFYDWFRTEPPGRRTLRVCRAEACQSMGGAALLEHVQSRLGIGLHETRADRAVTLEPVYCLGLCGCAPAVMVDDRVYGRVTPERFDELVASEALT